MTGTAEISSAFEGEYLSFELPEGVTATQREDGVYFLRADDSLQGRIYRWIDENGQPVSPDQADIAQILEQVLVTIYGEGERPETLALEGREGYRFRSVSAYADGTPCAVEICLMRSETAFYYMEVQGDENQAEAAGTLTDAVLATLKLG